MEVKFSQELGLKHINREAVKKFKPVENPGNIPGNDLDNKQLRQINKEAAAVRPSQAQTTYKVEGNTVNFQA